MRAKKMRTVPLRNQEHFQFMTELMELIQLNPEIELSLEALFVLFVTLYKQENAALRVVKRSVLTDDIALADHRRDDIYHGFTLMVESNTYSTKPEKVQAAKNIKIVMAHFGDFRRAGYNEESGSIHSLLKSLRSKCTEDIATIQVEGWLDDLDQANQAFDTLMDQRYHDNAEQETASLRQTRLEIDAVYRQMMDRINASLTLNPDLYPPEFVRGMNVRVDHYMHTLTARKARGKDTSEQESE